MSNLIKCMAAVHLPLTRRANRANDTWFERVDALAKDIQESQDKAVKAERERLLAEFEALALDLVERTRVPAAWGGTVIDGRTWDAGEAVKALAVKLRDSDD